MSEDDVYGELYFGRETSARQAWDRDDTVLH